MRLLLVSICQVCIYICAHTCLAAKRFPPLCSSVYTHLRLFFFSCLLTWLPLLFTHKKATSASEYSIAFGLELIMIVSLSLSLWADRHNIPLQRFLSMLSGKVFNPMWWSLSPICTRAHMYYSGARQRLILLAKSPCIHIKRVHMARNAAKRKTRNLNWRKTQSIVKKKEKEKRKMYSTQVEVNWTLVQAEKRHTFCIRKLNFNFCFRFFSWKLSIVYSRGVWRSQYIIAHSLCPHPITLAQVQCAVWSALTGCTVTPLVQDTDSDKKILHMYVSYSANQS